MSMFIFQAPSIEPPYITAKTFRIPAKGDFVTDDTAALQGAIDAAIAGHQSLWVESGTYRITSPLVIDNPKDRFTTGFLLSGRTGPARNAENGAGGVSIVLDAGATSAKCVLEIGKAAFRDMTIERIAFGSKVPDRKTPYGVLFSGTGFSHVTLNQIEVGGVDTAFASTPTLPAKRIYTTL
jgi:hypothetical protein